jgi:hypothetical protein
MPTAKDWPGLTVIDVTFVVTLIDDDNVWQPPVPVSHDCVSPGVAKAPGIPTKATNDNTSSKNTIFFIYLPPLISI